MSSINSHYRFAVSIEFQAYFGTWPPPAGAVNPKVWFGSHADIRYPDTVTPLKAALHEKDGISKFKWSAQFFTGKYTISKLQLKVVDKDGELSRAIADKLVDEVGSRRAVVRVYMLNYDEQVIDVGPFNTLSDSFDSQVIATYFLMDHDFDNGLITLECEDVVRDLMTTLFEDRDFIQNASVSGDSEFVAVYQGPLGDEVTEYSTFEHNETYTFDPGNPAQPAICGYKRFSNTGEIFSHEPEDLAFQAALMIKERGLFGTSVDPDGNPMENIDDPINGPQIENVVYLEEYAPTMLYSLLTGRTSQSLTSARTLPDCYSFNIDPNWINEYSFFGDNSNNGSADNLKLRILRHEPVEDGKSWVETNILGPMRSVLHVNRFGQIELVKQQAVKEGSEQITLDLSNVVAYSELRHVKSEIKNPVIIEYDKSILDGKYKRIVGNDDVLSTKINQQTDALRLQFETLFHGINTTNQVDKIRIGYQDFYGHEHQTMTVSVLPSLYFQNIQIGRRLKVKLPKVRDDAQIEDYDGDLTIDRTMMVMSAEFDPMTCEFQIELLSTLERATDSSRTANLSEIPDDKYPVDKVDLRDVVPGIFEDTNTTPSTFYVNDDAVFDGGRYYLPGNVLFNSDLKTRCAGTGDFEFWAMGELFLFGTIDTTGAGCHKPGVQQTIFGAETPGPGIYKGLRNQTMIAEGAYFGSPLAVGGTGLIYEGNFSASFRTVALPPIDPPSGEVEEVPELHLSNECGCLRGIPPSLSGTPSSGTPISYGVTRVVPSSHYYVPGLDGVHGGGGVAFVSRGGGFGPNGKVITNGEDAPPVEIIDGIQLANSGAMPGAFIWLTDGGSHPPPFDDTTIENHFEAYSGNSNGVWNPIRVSDYSFSSIFASTGGIRQWWQPSDERINRAKAASRHQYVPANQKLRESQNSHWLDSEADLNPDNVVKLWSTKDGIGFGELNADGLPPVPNPGSRDLWVSEIDLNSGNPQAQLSMWRYEVGVWTQITEYDATAALMLDICRISSASRLHFGLTRPTDCAPGELWIDNENTDKAVQCGATLAEDTIVWLRSYGEPGEDILEDGNFLIHELCESTWQTDTDPRRAPNIYPGAFPKYDEQIVGSTLFSATIGEDATPGFQLDATGNGSYRLLRPRRPCRIHPGHKYIVESVIRTTGFSYDPIAPSPSKHGYTVFLSVFDQNGVYLGGNGNDGLGNGDEHFHVESTITLNASGYFHVHEVFEIPETWTDARYMVPNCMVHALLGNVVVSQVHVRRLREQHHRDITPGPFTLASPAGFGGLGPFRQPSSINPNQQFETEIHMGSRFNFSIIADAIPDIDCNYRLRLYMRRGGVVQRTYSWTLSMNAGVENTLSADFDYIAEEYFDGFNWEFSFDTGVFINPPPITVVVVDDYVWSMNVFDVVEAGDLT